MGLGPATCLQVWYQLSYLWSWYGVSQISMWQKELTKIYSLFLKKFSKQNLEHKTTHTENMINWRIKLAIFHTIFLNFSINRRARPLKTSYKYDAVNDMMMEEQNMKYLSNPYLTGVRMRTVMLVLFFSDLFNRKKHLVIKIWMTWDNKRCISFCQIVLYSISDFFMLFDQVIRVHIGLSICVHVLRVEYGRLKI